uniref:Tal-like protein AA n=1 Tax=Anopheles epiroticus TaxID=199890 RepID=A0A182PN20_9DIPT
MNRKLDPTGMYRRPGSGAHSFQRSTLHHHQQLQNHQRMPHHHQQQQQHQVKCHYLDPTGLY